MSTPSSSEERAKRNLVSMQHIYKTFNPDTVSEVTVFRDFNLDIPRGQFVTVVGSNGSGKTTMLNLLCGSIPIDMGAIYLDGKPLGSQKEFQRASRIGRVFQDPSRGTCPELTILENMALAENKGKAFGLSRGVSRRRMDDYRTQLETLKLGLDDKLDVPVGSLSGGQRQALALLISTMTPIDLLILDEHTAALDPNSSATVMELTDQIVREKHLTSLMVTHNLKFAVQYGNRLLMMHEGHAVIDAADTEKEKLQMSDLLDRFNTISLELGNSL